MDNWANRVTYRYETLLPRALRHGLLTIAAVDVDPELSQNGIDLVCRLFMKDPGVPLQAQQRDSLLSLFAFTLSVLDGQEPLPKATAAEFWVSRIVTPN